MNLDTIDLGLETFPVLKNENIPPGVDAILPTLIANLNTPGSRAMIKQYAEYIDLGLELPAKMIGRGEFSVIYLLTIAGKEYTLKVTNRDTQSGYINYMHEMQMMHQLGISPEARVFAEEDNVYIPEYYFASVDMCLREYIPGQPLSEEAAATLVPAIDANLSPFLESKQQNSSQPYWQDKTVDLYSKSGIPTGKNFIVGTNGKIYLIDPFTN